MCPIPKLDWHSLLIATTLGITTMLLLMYLQDNNAVLFCLHRLDGVDPPLPALQNIPERKVDIAVVDELSLSDAEADIEFDN